MNLRLNDRKSGAALWFPGIVFDVQTMDWEMLGGPAKARVTARLSARPAQDGAARLGQLAPLLRCPATLSDERGAPCWWGYVHGVEIHLSAVFGLAVSLDGLYNRVAVRYRDERIAPEVNVGWQFQSAWVQDAASIAEYGKREGIFHLPLGCPAEAGSYAASLLAQQKRPALSAFRPSGSGSESSGQHSAKAVQPGGDVARASVYPYAVLHLRGWWQTLGWQFFSEARGFAGFSGGGAVQALGSAAGNLMAQSFTVGPGWTAVSGFAKLAKYGAPGDNICLDVRADNAGQPSGTLLLTAQLAGSGLSGEIGWTRFNFAAPALLSSGTYWAVLWRSGAADANNYYRAAVDEGLAFPGGVLKIWNGAAWVGRSPDADLVFSIHGQAETTEQIKTMADPIAGGGQFLRGAVVVDASGVQARQFRDGRSSTLEEIRALLELGASAGEAMMAYINAERWLVVRKVSAGPAAFLILPDGEIRDRSGAAICASINPLGKWAMVQGMEQAGGDMNTPAAVLITRAAWRGGRLHATFGK